MKVFEKREFSGVEMSDRESGRVIEGFDFHQCYFQGAFLSLAADPELRSTVRNVRLVNCSQRGCTIYNAVCEDVLVDGFNTHGQLLISHGAVFKHVVLKGKIDRIFLCNDVFPPVSKSDAVREREIAAFREANSKYYRDVDWALDISEGEFRDLSFRGLPAHLIRRDPETQFLITREKALDKSWKDLEFHDPLWAFSLDSFLQRGEPAIVFVAPKRHRKFKSYLADLQTLRKAGVAEPD